MTDCDEFGVRIGEKNIPSSTVVWAAGVEASPAGRWLGVESDRAGRVVVNDNLSVPAHPSIFVIGDTAAVKDTKGNPVPGIAPAAKQQGRYVASISCHQLALAVLDVWSRCSFNSG